MRKLIYYIATTVDGFIAAEDGSFDAFPMQGEHFRDLIADYPETFPAHLRAPLGITAANQRFDAVLMGRATYEVGLPNFPNPYAHLEQYVFSTTLVRAPDPAIQLVKQDALAFVRALKQRPGRDIWLCGGGRLATDLFAEIDELILKLNPLVLGKGRPLFTHSVPPTLLKPLDRKVYDNGFVRLHYALR